jgi:hypothetical protein
MDHGSGLRGAFDRYLGESKLLRAQCGLGPRLRPNRSGRMTRSNARNSHNERRAPKIRGHWPGHPLTKTWIPGANKLLILVPYRILLALAVALLLAPTRTDGGQENVAAYGIWVGNQTLVTFAQVYPCPPNDLTPPGAAQIFVSDDGGAHWEKRGPELDGSEFQYFRAIGDRLWVVGEHTAEGPAIEPFIFVPNEKGFDWTQHVIYKDAAELEGIAAQSDGGFTAWIRHLKLHDNGWTGPLYLHQSSDGGLTWHVVSRAKKVPSAPRAGFKKIEKQAENWRVREQESGVSTIEHRADVHSEWKSVYRFPGNACGGQK